jgi:hypothetical protein
MKEKEKNIYGIHQYTLTRRRKIRGKKRKIKRKPNKEEGKQKSKRINQPRVASLEGSKKASRKQSSLPIYLPSDRYTPNAQRSSSKCP